MQFDILPSDSLPIYRQIVEQVRRWVASGSAQAGEELPSVRQLAQLHAINPMTVSKAYSLLEAEGLLERRRGMGMVIRSGSQQAAPQPLELLRPTLLAAAQQATQLGLSPAEAQALFQECMDLAQAARHEAKTQER